MDVPNPSVQSAGVDTPAQGIGRVLLVALLLFILASFCCIYGFTALIPMLVADPLSASATAGNLPES
jgi:hypothetical protein